MALARLQNRGRGQFGQPRNPRTLAMPAALPVPEQQLPDFLAHAAPLLTRLDLLANVTVAQVQ